MPPEPACEIKHIHVLKRHAVILKKNLQAGDVCALGLREFVDVAFGEDDGIVRVGIEGELVRAVFKSAKGIDALGPEQFTQ